MKSTIDLKQLELDLSFSAYGSDDVVPTLLAYVRADA